MLTDFTGSDWCPGCIHLRKNIFDTDAFAKYAADHQFVLLELDFPKAAGKMPPEQLKFHEELMRRYGVSSFPSVLLMEGNGAPYAKIVGATRTPEEYLKKLEAAGETEIHQNDLERIEHVTHPAMTKLLQRLESKQLIRCVPSERDRRYKKITCTEQSAEIYKMILAQDQEVFSELCRTLTKEQQQQLLVLADMILKNIDEE